MSNHRKDWVIDAWRGSILASQGLIRGRIDEKKEDKSITGGCADSGEISLVLEGNATSKVREVAAIVPQPTGLHESTRVPTIRRHANEVGVAAGEALGPPRNERVGVTLKLVGAAEVAATGEPSLPSHEGVLADRLIEEEADVAGETVSNPHWFWEILEQAGYDVW